MITFFYREKITNIQYNKQVEFLELSIIVFIEIKRSLACGACVDDNFRFSFLLQLYTYSRVTVLYIQYAYIIKTCMMCIEYYIPTTTIILIS